MRPGWRHSVGASRGGRMPIGRGLPRRFGGKPVSLVARGAVEVTVEVTVEVADEGLAAGRGAGARAAGLPRRLSGRRVAVVSARVRGGSEWSARVDVLLTATGLTWHGLALRLGVAPEMAYRWRSARVFPSAKHRAAVSVVLGDERLRQVETTADGGQVWRG